MPWARWPVRLRDGHSALREGLNLNVHFHTLVLDGVFTEGPGDMLRFQPTPPPTDEEVGLVLAARVRRLLRRRGLDAEADVPPPDLLAEESAALAGISSASIQGRIALGRRAGGRVWRLGEEPDAPWIVSNTPRHAQLDGFDLHANVAVPASDRARLEQLCRYLLRPAVSQDRLQLLGDGRVLLALKTAWADGTRHLLFEPLELLEKLAALTPTPPDQSRALPWGAGPPCALARPRGGRWRPTRRDLAAWESERGRCRRAADAPPLVVGQLMHRAFEIDVLACPRCGGRMRLLATVEDPREIQEILSALALSAFPMDRAPPPSKSVDADPTAAVCA